MAATFSTFSYLASAVLMLVVVGWLLSIKAGSRRNRAFALFLFLRAMGIISLHLTAFTGHTGDSIGLAFWRYFSLAQPFALAWFTTLIVRPRTTSWVGAGFAAGGIGACSAYLYDRCLEYCSNPDLVFGPLILVSYTTFPLLSTAGLLAALAARNSKTDWSSIAAWLLAAGLTINGLFDGFLPVVDVLINGAAPTTNMSSSVGLVWGAWAISAAALPIGVAALWIIVRAARTELQRPAWGTAVIVGATIALFASILIVGEWTRTPIGVVLASLLRGTLPAMVAYGLVRHRLSQSPSPARGPIRASVIGGILMAVFFGVTEAAVTWSGEMLQSSYLGIGATAAMLVFVAPLRHAGSKISAKLTSGPEETPLDMYREHAYIIWSDGVMGIKERLLLDRLRERLAIPPAAAMAIERDAAAAAR